MTVIGEILAVVGAIGSFVPGLLKKKPYVLWYLDEDPPLAKWKEIGTFSARQCRKALEKLVSIGYDRKKFVILRKGIKPEVNP